MMPRGTPGHLSERNLICFPFREDDLADGKINDLLYSAGLRYCLHSGTTPTGRTSAPAFRIRFRLHSLHLQSPPSSTKIPKDAEHTSNPKTVANSADVRFKNELPQNERTFCGSPLHGKGENH